MTGYELLLKQLAGAQRQVTQAIDGLDAEHAESRANELGMTIREQVAHLAEAAIATTAAIEGRTHSWGSYAPTDASWEGTKQAWLEARAAAVARLKDDEEAIMHAHDYLVAHDYYHVGQICAARRTVEPSWDTYAIYA